MYEFMTNLKRSPQPSRVIGLHEIFFFPVGQSEIDEAEQILRMPFPMELERFYLEIGWGQLQTGSNGIATDFNYVASPTEIVGIINGTSEWLMPYSQIEENTLPFFQRDVDLFLCLHPKSENPNAVWWMWGEQMPNNGKICDSLVEFFQRLVVDPDWFNPSTP